MEKTNGKTPLIEAVLKAPFNEFETPGAVLRILEKLSNDKGSKGQHQPAKEPAVLCRE